MFRLLCAHLPPSIYLGAWLAHDKVCWRGRDVHDRSPDAERLGTAEWHEPLLRAELRQGI